MVAANIAPFLRGGADDHIEGLVAALRGHGHEVVCLRFPFRFSPTSAIESLMAFCEDYDINAPNGVRIERLISLQFPAYGLLHDDHRVWLMHQHRAAYELYDAADATDAERQLRERIQAFDDRVLARIPRRFANSARVAERLQAYNAIQAEPLYHPPKAAQQFYTDAAEPYIFYPSRLESLKRQDLLIEAARRLRSPVGMIIAGDGGQHERYTRLIEQHGLRHRVRMLGRITEAEKRAFYAHALGVFYGPRDEDYGYVTLEAMLAHKPLITCSDSGGPLEFVQHEQTGLIVDPTPDAVAAAVDWLHGHPADAAAMGRAGRQRYQALDISWSRVVDTLLA